MSRIKEAKDRVDYYTVTPKGFKLLTMLSDRMAELDRQWKASGQADRTSTPGWAEYTRVFHTVTI